MSDERFGRDPLWSHSRRMAGFHFAVACGVGRVRRDEYEGWKKASATDALAACGDDVAQARIFPLRVTTPRRSCREAVRW
jgi:hypothetical protein